MKHKGFFRRRIFALLGLLAVLVVIWALTSVLITRGETVAKASELHNVQSAVRMLMFDNNLTNIPNPVTVATNDMTAFPDVTTLAIAKGLTVGDKDGYLLYGHDPTPDGRPEPVVNYVSFAKSTWTYTVGGDGKVSQGNKG